MYIEIHATIRLFKFISQVNMPGLQMRMIFLRLFLPLHVKKKNADKLEATSKRLAAKESRHIRRILLTFDRK